MKQTFNNLTHINSAQLKQVAHWFVPNGGTLLVVILLLFTQNVGATPLLAPVNAPGPSATTINYQGRLADNNGSALNGNYSLKFTIYDALTNGSAIWGPENHTGVSVSDGLFSLGLGSQTGGGIPTNVWNGDRYLEVEVNGETLTPRELIRSVPLAGMALTVPDGAIGSEQQTVTTYHDFDNQSVVLNGTASVTVSDFSFNNVPAGDVTIMTTLIGGYYPGKSNLGTVELVVPNYPALNIVPTHVFQARKHTASPSAFDGGFAQLTLHGHIQDFPGGTLQVQIRAKGENSETQVYFGANLSSTDPRFGRRITVIAGQ